MPQPLSRVHPNLGFALATGNTPHSPEMAASVLNVINLWSQIDHSYAILLARIGHADPVTTSAIFQSIVSGEAKKDALFNAADASLGAEEAALIKAVVDASKASRKQRNDFAHHLWGSLNTRADCVILVDPKTSARFGAEVLAWRGQGQRPELDRSEIMVWTQDDLRQAERSAQAAHDWSAQLPFTILGHPARLQRRQSLLAHQPIQQRYDRYLQNNA